VYDDGRIRVLWDATLCIHTAVCLQRLPQVFDVRAHPWLDLAGAAPEEIAATIRAGRRARSATTARRSPRSCANDPDSFSWWCLLVFDQQTGECRADSSEPSRSVMVRGALFTLRRRCGKRSCHCANEAGHESQALAYPEGGRTKTMTLAAADVEEVRAALERYNAARAELDAAADAGVALLRARSAERRRSR
jgi:uncharacterized Fe-S cluster protein YjdI